MPDRKIRQILDELHGSLERSPDLDADTRSQLEGAAGEIRAVLDEGTTGDGGFRERLEAQLGRFEGNHPRLTEVVRRLVDQLSEMGI